MATLKAQQAGGRVMAKRQRQAALDRYYKDPNKCRWCNSVIEVPDSAKVRQIRKKKFCNQSCAAKYNNRRSDRPKRKPKSQGICTECNADIFYKQRKFCISCWDKTRIKNKTKKEAGTRSIHHHAKYIGDKLSDSRSCLQCGYDLHVELCHVKAVADFPDDTLLHVINAPENLLFLCPNCHWELDNGFLDPTSLVEKAKRLRSSVSKDR